MPQYLLIVTEDGFGKRVPLADVRRKNRNVVGVKLSSVPIAAVMVVESTVDAVVLATAGGKVERVSIGSFPIRRRSTPKTGGIPRGARIMRLDPGDRVASVAPVGGVKTPPAALRDDKWPGTRVGFNPGERVESCVRFCDVRDPDESEPGGEPVVLRDEWAQTEVHNASKYWCLRCGRPYPDPSSAYKCIDSHIPEMLREAA